jgi:hypothetical protein
MRTDRVATLSVCLDAHATCLDSSSRDNRTFSLRRFGSFIEGLQCRCPRPRDRAVGPAPLRCTEVSDLDLLFCGLSDGCGSQATPYRESSPHRVWPP